MIGRLKKLRTSTNSFVPGSAVFPNVDVDKVSKDLDLTKHAAERGRQNRPAADEGSLDPVEAQIVEKVSEVRRLGLNNYEDHVRVYAQRLARAADARTQIETQIGNARTETSGLIKVWDGFLQNDESDVTMRSREYREFVERNRLGSRTARDAANRLMFWLVLIFMVLVESVMNATFFATSNEQGLFGGFTIAVAIAFVNIGFAVLCGPAALPEPCAVREEAWGPLRRSCLAPLHGLAEPVRRSFPGRCERHRLGERGHARRHQFPGGPARPAGRRQLDAGGHRLLPGAPGAAEKPGG